MYFLFLIFRIDHRRSNGWRMSVGVAGMRFSRLVGNVQHFTGTMQRHAQGAAGVQWQPAGHQSAAGRGSTNHSSGHQGEIEERDKDRIGETMPAQMADIWILSPLCAKLYLHLARFFL